MERVDGETGKQEGFVNFDQEVCVTTSWLHSGKSTLFCENLIENLMKNRTKITPGGPLWL